MIRAGLLLAILLVTACDRGPTEPPPPTPVITAARYQLTAEEYGIAGVDWPGATKCSFPIHRNQRVGELLLSDTLYTLLLIGEVYVPIDIGEECPDLQTRTLATIRSGRVRDSGDRADFFQGGNLVGYYSPPWAEQIELTTTSGWTAIGVRMWAVTEEGDTLRLVAP